MAISGIHSGMQIIQQSHDQLEKASEDLQPLNTDPTEVSSLDSVSESSTESKSSSTDALISINQAQSYNRVGANIVQRSNEMIGTLLDIHV